VSGAPGGLHGEHPQAGAFNALTPEQVLDAVEAGGRRCTGRFLTLNSYENRVYQLELDDETMVVGKFYRPGRWSREAILDEHDFLLELEEEEIPVAGPIELDDEGETLGQLTGEVAGIHYALFPRIGGRVPDELDDTRLRILGRLLARIHNVGAVGDGEHRPTLEPDTYGRLNLAWLMDNDAVPVEARENYRLTVEALLTRIDPLFNDVPIHRIHGDCHRGNLLWTPEGAMFLDFDDLVVGPAAQDVWMLVPSSDAEGERQREVLLEAYREFRDFNPDWLRLVEPLRALRYIHYSTWIARRWQDPTFKRTFNEFGTLRYWQRETQDLREQIARIDAERDARNW
jgi:Ser/Thr protein kinase RdoA (MazF antagonist)